LNLLIINFNFMGLEQFLIDYSWLLLLLGLWTLPWKGVALWKAARNTHKWWFIALLVINTLAVLEIIYIFIFSRRQKEQL